MRVLRLEAGRLVRKALVGIEDKNNKFLAKVKKLEVEQGEALQRYYRDRGTNVCGWKIQKVGNEGVSNV